MIIHGRLLLDPHAPPEPGWIRVEGERIAQVEAGVPRATPDIGGPNYLISPSFIDAHIHLPQIASVGYDGMELLDWLQQVIFPAEATWTDPSEAERHITLAHRRMLSAGTLGYAGYLTAHSTGLRWMERTSRDHAMPRAVAGQVLMDRNGPIALIGEQPLDPASIRVPQPHQLSVNPRFAVSCTPQMLAAAARLAGADRIVQTHLAESRRECELVKSLFPDSQHYTAVYDSFGLLTERTLLAHCIHLSAEEWQLISQRKSVIVHCPGANTFLRAGMFDLTSARKHDVRLALGTDVAAGPDVAMPRVARAMIEVAKLRAMSCGRASFIPTPADAWHLMTRGNADALGWRDTGRIEVGARADLLALRMPEIVDGHVLGRLIYSWDDSLIAERVLGGIRLDERLHRTHLCD